MDEINVTDHPELNGEPPEASASEPEEQTAEQLRHDGQIEYETQQGEPPMPRYRSHKVVQALEVEVRRVPTPDPGTRIELVPLNPLFKPIQPSQDWCNRHRPAGRGYYVVYPDGYVSWSPADSFESGYTLLEEESAAEEEQTADTSE